MRKLIFLVVLAVLVGSVWSSCGEHAADHQEESKSAFSQHELDSLLLIGKEYAESAQKVLGENLMASLSSDGPVGALKFCNVKALQLTDSSAKAMDVDLKRVTDKARNPLNTANIEELEIIGSMKQELKDKGQIAPRIFQENEEVLAYYPIVTKPMCLQCHGIPEKEINPETLAVINSIYLADKATGYGINEVRGMWKVIMSKDLNQAVE